MQLESLKLVCYKSVLEETLRFGRLNLLIGANASGKSNILDALRLLADGVRERDYAEPVNARGGILHLAWKGEAASAVGIQAHVTDDEVAFDWTVELVRRGYDFTVRESVLELPSGAPPAQLLGPA